MNNTHLRTSNLSREENDDTSNTVRWKLMCPLWSVV